MAYNCLSPYQTKVVQSPGNVAVIYRGTTIVDASPDQIVLNTGGWFTVTTKRKMNQASLQFGLPFAVWQEKGLWYVSPRAADGAFVPGAEPKRFEDDTFTIDRNA